MSRSTRIALWTAAVVMLLGLVAGGVALNLRVLSREGDATVGTLSPVVSQSAAATGAATPRTTTTRTTPPKTATTPTRTTPTTPQLQTIPQIDDKGGERDDDGGGDDRDSSGSGKFGDGRLDDD
ncbi:MAG: hypothetical protein JWM90_172 [Thermoleophilia bacterium]|nr:hypothetical protein [Thermoleophilia bacterium]